MANIVYMQPEAPITWLDSGGTNVLTLTSLASLAGRQGALHDFGATTARSRLYRWRFYCQFATTPVLGERVEVYAKTGDGTHRDNDDGTDDAALSSVEKLRNLSLLGVLSVDEATADLEMSCSGTIAIESREFQPVIYNRTADALTATASEHGFTLTPVPDEIQ